MDKGNQEMRNEKYEAGEVIVATRGRFDAKTVAKACCGGASTIRA